MNEVFFFKYIHWQARVHFSSLRTPVNFDVFTLQFIELPLIEHFKINILGWKINYSNKSQVK
jgi:hypothetical protein